LSIECSLLFQQFFACISIAGRRFQFRTGIPSERGKDQKRSQFQFRRPSSVGRVLEPVLLEHYQLDFARLGRRSMTQNRSLGLIIREKRERRVSLALMDGFDILSPSNSAIWIVRRFALKANGFYFAQ
jgi:hypothetical protein